MSNKDLQKTRSQKGVKIKLEDDGDVSSVKLRYNKQKSANEALNGQFVVLYDLERDQSGNLF